MLAELLLIDKSIEELQANYKEYELGLQETEKLKTTLLNEMRKGELEQRKLAN
jgi:hypothetical protein